jgi:hypothetical protein
MNKISHVNSTFDEHYIGNPSGKAGQECGRHRCRKTLFAMVSGNRAVHGAFECNHPQHRSSSHCRKFGSNAPEFESRSELLRIKPCCGYSRQWLDGRPFRHPAHICSRRRNIHFCLHPLRAGTKCTHAGGCANITRNWRSHDAARWAARHSAHFSQIRIIGCNEFRDYSRINRPAALSWVLEIFGEHYLDATLIGILIGLSLTLLAAYGLHARQHIYPLLQLALFKTRTFRVAVAGGFITRLGLGGMPFLLPLLYQVGLGLPAWQSGLLLMPAAAAAMFMKVISIRLLKQFGYRSVLIVNTLLIGTTIMLFATVNSSTAIGWIIALSLAQGLFNSLQYSSMNSMAYADISSEQASMASTIASSLQQLSISFGLAFASIIAGLYLGDSPQSDRIALTNALHNAFLTLGGLTIISSLSFWSLRRNDGDNVSRGMEENDGAG